MDINLIKKISEDFGRDFSLLEKSLNLIFTAKSSFNLLSDQDGLTYIVKEIPSAYIEKTTPEGYFSALDLFISYLNDNGVPVINYLKSKYNKISFNTGNQYYVIMPFIEGQHYSTNDNEIESIATLHGKANKILSELPPDKVDQIKMYCKNLYFRQDVSLDDLRKKALDRVSTISNDREALKLFNEVALPLVDKYINIVSDEIYESLPKQVAHKDIFPGNVLFLGEDKEAFLLDPDELSYMPRVRDVAYGMWGFCCRKPPQKGVFPLDVRQANLYLKNYLSKGELTDKEISLIPQVMVRIWVEDVLHHALLSDFSDEDKSNVERKIKHLKHAVEAQDELKFNRE